MSLTYEDHGGIVVTISDEGMRRLAAESATNAQTARRNEITTAVVAAAATIFALYELITQAGSLT
ncbi:hypothetical protein G3N95_29835 [Paraburkholderia sp. Tr-20389]|uniref:hypothetical protein n=1 Tax=Paraburkholderia sp. Tr-20389 TaxID=2703903 RepID=UPI00198032EA|nr:hypothetical protein [Paraburkholderia sp. Tr-20389]MBN3757176.1 hypothetical protein [Paraburkholderia sp. Tr-20389]